MKIETLTLVAPKPKGAFNRHRLYSLPLHGPLDEARQLLRNCCNKLIMAQYEPAAPVRIMFKTGFWIELAPSHPAPHDIDTDPLNLLLLDKLIPYEPKNVVMTYSEYNAVLTFAGQLALLQTRSETPLLPRYTKQAVGQMLSDLFSTNVTHIRFQL